MRSIKYANVDKVYSYLSPDIWQTFILCFNSSSYGIGDCDWVASFTFIRTLY